MKTLAGPQSGARGDEVASRNRSGQFLRQRVSPKNPRTAAQRRVRKHMRTFSRLWNKITEPQRTAWCADACNVLSRPKLGKPRPLDGQKFFNRRPAPSSARTRLSRLRPAMAPAGSPSCSA
jgi:hypothetical protein